MKRLAQAHSTLWRFRKAALALCVAIVLAFTPWALSLPDTPARAGFDLYKLRPVDAARTCFVPALFGCASDDILVRPHHSKQIFTEYAGDKNVVRFEGDHNDLRPGFFNDSAAIFLKQVLLLSESADRPLSQR